MTFFYGFAIGMSVGVYLTQNYDVPNIKHWTTKALTMIKRFEKDKPKPT